MKQFIIKLKKILLEKVSKLTEQFVKQALISYGLANKFVTREIKAGLLLPEVLVKAAAASLGCATRLNVVVVDALKFIALIHIYNLLIIKIYILVEVVMIEVVLVVVEVVLVEVVVVDVVAKYIKLN